MTALTPKVFVKWHCALAKLGDFDDPDGGLVSIFGEGLGRLFPGLKIAVIEE
jgi:hypothetical protein